MGNYYGAASRAAQRELGGIFRVRQTVVAVGVDQVQLLPYDSNRVTLSIINVGTTIITIGTEAGITAGQGILLLANGSSVSLNWRDDADIVASRFYAIGNLAAGSVFTFEGVQAFESTE